MGISHALLFYYTSASLASTLTRKENENISLGSDHYENLCTTKIKMAANLLA